MLAKSVLDLSSNREETTIVNGGKQTLQKKESETGQAKGVQNWKSESKTQEDAGINSLAHLNNDNCASWKMSK